MLKRTTLIGLLISSFGIKAAKLSLQYKDNQDEIEASFNIKDVVRFENNQYKFNISLKNSDKNTEKQISCKVYKKKNNKFELIYKPTFLAQDNKPFEFDVVDKDGQEMHLKFLLV